MTVCIMKKKIYKKRKRGPVQAKKVTYDGIKFASGLERYMYMALKKAKIKAKYEGETYEVVSGFDFINPSYERMRRNNKVNPKLAKIIARKKYAERQIDKWVKWSWNQRGKIKYKELVSYQDQYNIKVYG